MKTLALCRYAICQGLEEFGLGARELRRALRGFLEDPIAFSILKHQAQQFPSVSSSQTCC